MSEFGVGDAVQQIGVDRVVAACRVVVLRVCLVLIDTPTADGAIHDADRHVMGGFQMKRQRHGEIADEEVVAFAGRKTPSVGRPSVGTDKGVSRQVVRQTVGSESV